MVTEENILYLRFILLLVEGGTELLRKITEKALNKLKTALCPFLLSVKTKLMGSKDLTTKQKEFLFPSSSSGPDIKDFDITLLSFIIIHHLKDDLDGNERNAATQIKDIRNKYYAHVCNPSMTITTFTKEYTKLSNIIHTIAYGMSNGDKQQLLDILESVNDAEINVQRVFEELKRLDISNIDIHESIRQSLEEVVQSQKDLVAAVKEVTTEQRKMNESLSEMREELIEIKAQRENHGKITKVVNTVFGKVYVGADSPETIRKIESVIVRESGESPEEDRDANSEVKGKVNGFVADIEKLGVKVASVKEGSIVFEFKCPCLDVLLDLLDYFCSSRCQKRLDDIAMALEHIFDEKVYLSGFIDLDSLQEVITKMHHMEHEKVIQFEMECTGVDSLLHVLDVFEEDKAANSLNELSKALSDTVGKPVTLHTAIDVDQMQRAIDSLKEQLVAEDEEEQCRSNQGFGQSTGKDATDNWVSSVEIPTTENEETDFNQKNSANNISYTKEPQSKPKISFSNMKQPPLLKQLKNILSEYPDGGQILKELIQNAEDAGATDFRVMYDERRINTSNKAKFTTFFTGPALLVYNDSVFTESDWEGIQMIYSSIKENDPLKVGRFGLGFKSVFHLTDYPCVVSGSRLLMMDPQQDLYQVNASVSLEDLEMFTDSGLDPGAFWKAFDGIYGLNRTKRKLKIFPGTLFRFPLREKPSALSETVYNEGKVFDLFDELKRVSSSIFLFLHNIERVSIDRRDNLKVTQILVTEIEDPDGEIKTKRTQFKQNIQLLSPSFIGREDIYYVASMKICSTDSDGSKSADWLLVEYFVCKDMSVDFHNLVHDRNLCYSPIVGVAAPLSSKPEKFEGHVFCFLPLPREGEPLTGLPIHVNGHFSLSQNRHHIKWETDEQQGKQLYDKSILWNKALISEALPRAYENLILEAVSIAEANSNRKEYVDFVYDLMRTSKISSEKHSRWVALESNLFKNLKGKLISFSPTIGKWISCKEAYYATFECSDKHLQNAVISCMHIVGMKYVDVPEEVAQILKKHYPYLKHLTQESLAHRMRTNRRYVGLSDFEKYKVLDYLKEAGNPTILEGLQLLNLVSGDWIEYDAAAEKVYLCSFESIELFPGMYHRLVLEPEDDCVLDNIANAEVYQIRKLDEKAMKQLIEEVVKQRAMVFPGGEIGIHGDEASVSWLKAVLTAVSKTSHLEYYKDVPLLPRLREISPSFSQVIQLLKMSDLILLSSLNNITLSPAFCECFEKMGVKVLKEINWIPDRISKECIFVPTSSGIVSLLSEINRKCKKVAVVAFNTYTGEKPEVLQELKKILQEISVEGDAAEFLCELNLFKCISSHITNPVSLRKIPRYTMNVNNVPNEIDYPGGCIIVDRNEANIIQHMNLFEVEEVSYETLIFKAIQRMSESQDKGRIIRFMEYFCNNISCFEQHSDICQLASNIQFLKVGDVLHKPKDLFDPSDQLLSQLFYGEDLFPEINYTASKQILSSLRQLGLKGVKEIKADDLWMTGKLLDQRFRHKVFTEKVSLVTTSDMTVSEETRFRNKAESFMAVLMQRPSLLKEICTETSETLAKSIRYFSWVPVKRERPADFPGILPWFSEKLNVCKPDEVKEEALQLLVGSSTATVFCPNQDLNNAFGWRSIQDISPVVEQLCIVAKHYTKQTKPEVLNLTQKIYHFLASQQHKINKSVLKGKCIIWTGDGFHVPDRVIVNKSPGDINLEPYLYFIPEEFEDYHSFFLNVGCNIGQDATLCIEVLETIKDKHDNRIVSVTDLQRDEIIVLDILKYLAKEMKNHHINLDKSSLMMLAENDEPDSKVLNLRPASSCVFTFDDMDSVNGDSEEVLYIVHHLVPIEVSTTLGVRSISTKTLDESCIKLAIEEWGQSETLTTRLRCLLKEGYRDGLAISKELLQNADDAGATVIKFLFDERLHLHERKTLLSSQLAEFQGPALWVFNDSLFTKEDIENITRLNGGTKAQFSDKIGKFGLGFSSVYNLTDLPSFISGNNLVIFDPHERYLTDVKRSRGTGLKLNLKHRRLIHHHKDQFVPYSGIFTCNILDKNFDGFKGTLFRFPLRTEEQALQSLLCSHPYTRTDVVLLLEKIIENAGNMLLFSQSVTSIQIFHLPKEATSPQMANLIFTINKQYTASDTIKTRVDMNVLKHISSRMLKDPYNEIHEECISSKCFSQTLVKKELEVVNSESTWIISWATGREETLQFSSSLTGSLPVSCVAIPVESTKTFTPVPLEVAPMGFYKNGHIFCFLPLPLATELPFHINGAFRVSSDRRSLFYTTEDDNKDSLSKQWNESLLEDPLVEAHIYLLEKLSEKCNENYKYDLLWPTDVSTEMMPFTKSFYRKLFRKKLRLFKGKDGWYSVDDIMFLDPTVRFDSKIGDAAFRFLCNVSLPLEKHLVEMKPEVLESIRNAGFKTIFTHKTISEEIFMHIFLDQISNQYWESEPEERISLLRHALLLDSETVAIKLRDISCIPSDRERVLLKAKELVDPFSDIGGMFDHSEGHFPVKNLVGQSHSEEHAKLLNLGMNSVCLPKNLLVDRCRSVESLALVCSECAKERCLKVIQYMRRPEILDDLENDNRTLTELRNIKFLPVLARPLYWKFSFGSTSTKEPALDLTCKRHRPKQSGARTCFERPTSLFKQEYHYCIGTLADFVNEKDFLLSGQLIRILGVKDQVPVHLLVDQLTLLHEEYTNVDEQYRNLKQICEGVYETLATLFQREEEIKQNHIFAKLRETPTILIGKELIKPVNVAIHVKEECKGFYKLPASYMYLKEVFAVFGVNQNFTVQQILSALSELAKCEDCEKNSDIDRVSKLLCNLCDIMKRKKMTYADIVDKNLVVAPDKIGRLRPTFDLVIDDQSEVSTATLHTLHDIIQVDVGKFLGVKSKRIKLVESFSQTFYKPFGQSERLVTRLSGILEDYPCDSSILKELLQNADDAGASELHLIKNYEYYTSDSILGNAEIQGPSLCIFNDSHFSEDDFKGIQNLGIGSKRDDPTKAGQYGIGFNSVYHLTDTPCFLTVGPGLGSRGKFCVLDPLMTNLDELTTKENPGIICDVEKMLKTFPNMMHGYPYFAKMQSDHKGTMFRLPLRQKPSAISKNVLSTSKVDLLLEEFKQTMTECLLFMKSVKTIKVLKYQNGSYDEEYSVSAKMTPEDTETHSKYYEKLKSKFVKKKRNTDKYFSMEPIQSTYILHVIDTLGKDGHWIISNRFGTSEVVEKFADIAAALRDKTLDMLPKASVALQIPELEKDTIDDPATKGKSNNGESAQNMTGKLFCFLPLPLETGLPVHINGHFSLDKARTKLIDEGIRKHWNEFILKELATKALLTAIDSFKTEFVEKQFAHNKDATDSLCLMDLYHRKFPLLQSAKDHFSKLLVESFYSDVVRKKLPMFPTLLFASSTRKETSDFAPQESVVQALSWVPIADNNVTDAGVFNDIDFYLAKTQIRDVQARSRKLENTLKNIGMKIIETPLSVKETFEKCEIYTETSSPQFVGKFLLTSQQKETSCKIGQMGSLLEETSIKDIHNLKDILKYVLSDDENTKRINGLPLCVTCSRKLVTFNVDSPLFCSSMSNTLKGSPDRFLHPLIAEATISSMLLKAGVIKNFGVDDLAEIIDETYPVELLGKGLHVDWNRNDHIKPEALERLFMFVYENSLVYTWKHPIVDTDLLQLNLRKIGNWSFLPGYYEHEKRQMYKLFPIKDSSYIICKELVYDDVSEIVRDLSIPKFDTSIFSNKHLILPFERMFPSTRNPTELLKCLYCHADKLRGIKADQSRIILKYFSDRIKTIQEKIDEKELKKMLVNLPLYETHYGEVVTTAWKGDVLILPEDMPGDGMDVFCKHTNILFLKDTGELRRLFEYLEFPKKSDLQIYAEDIVPNMDDIPKGAWLIHVKYIKDKLMSSKTKDISLKPSLISQIKQLKFVNVSGMYKKVSDLYDPRNELFSQMLKPEDILPEEFISSEWIEFMILLGLVQEPSDYMLVEFSLRLEQDAADLSSDVVVAQSKALVQCLFTADWKTETMNIIRNIKFVVPYRVSANKQELFPQHSTGESLVCFNGAVSSQYEDFCWTSMNLLTDIPISENSMASLGVFKRPPLSFVIQHCKNLCSVLSSEEKLYKLNRKLVQDQMNILYSFFLQNFDKDLKEKLKETKIVYLPEEDKMVSVNRIVININEEEEIKPFLYRLPACFGPYQELFIKLGAKEFLNLHHCANVLADVEQSFHNIPVPPNMLFAVQKALRNLARFLDQENTSFDNVHEIYLPNRENIMKRSNELVFPNNLYIENRLSGSVLFCYVQDFRKLQVKNVHDQEHMLLNFPVHLRPNFLSDIVEEKVSTDTCEILESEMADKIENFIHCPFLIEGILRLIKQQLKQCKKPFDESFQKTVALKLSNARVIRVKRIQTYLEFRGEPVPNTEEDALCFVNRGEDSYELWFQTDDEGKAFSDILDDNNGLSKLIDMCTGDILQKYLSKHVATILRMIDNPSLISRKLDKLKVVKLDLFIDASASTFPKPGTYVEEKFYPFLEQSISPFKVHEYMFVALELQDPDDDEFHSENLKYVYAHIIRPSTNEHKSSDAELTYIVDAGQGYDGFVTVPITRLYRFKPKNTGHSTNIDIEPVGPSLEEDFRQTKQMLIDAWKLGGSVFKRVVRRLLMRWHPDRNRQNEEHARRVFSFVHEAVLKLETGECFDESFSQSVPLTYTSHTDFGKLLRHVSEAGPVFARAYYSNMHEYNSTTRSDYFSHYLAEEATVRHIGEAKRWLRQATHDFKSAVSNMRTAEEDQSFNWICYKCHQACEKALKAAWFSKNANKATQYKHNLSLIAKGLDKKLYEKAMLFEELTGNYYGMRYPFTYAEKNTIPSDIFDRSTAETAVDLTKSVLEMCSDIIQ